MKGYYYHPINYAYICEIDLDLDPLETEKQGEDCYLIPANCTTIEAPIENIVEGKWLMWNVGTNQWILKDDYINKKIFEIDVNGFIINSKIVSIDCIERFELGDKIGIEPDSTLIKPKWENSEWIEGELIENIKADKIKSIKYEAYKIITEVYPLWKQINIESIYQGYTETDKETMGSYILDIRQQSDVFEAELEALTTIQEVKDYTFEYIIPT